MSQDWNSGNWPHGSEVNEKLDGIIDSSNTKTYCKTIEITSNLPEDPGTQRLIKSKPYGPPSIGYYAVVEKPALHNGLLFRKIQTILILAKKNSCKTLEFKILKN